MSRKTNKLWYLNYPQQSKWQFSDLRFRNFSLKETELCKWGCDKKSSLQSLRASQLNFNHSCPILTFYQFLRNSKKKKKEANWEEKRETKKVRKMMKKMEKSRLFPFFFEIFLLNYPDCFRDLCTFLLCSFCYLSFSVWLFILRVFRVGERKGSIIISLRSNFGKGDFHLALQFKL